MKCKDCKYWGERPSDRDYGNCSCPKFVNEGSGYNPDELALIDNYGHYGVSFETGPDFGCIHFTPWP